MHVTNTGPEAFLGSSQVGLSQGLFIFFFMLICCFKVYLPYFNCFSKIHDCSSFLQQVFEPFDKRKLLLKKPLKVLFYILKNYLTPLNVL